MVEQVRHPECVSVMEKISDICDDPIHQNPTHVQVFPNWQGFESPLEPNIFSNVLTRDQFIDNPIFSSKLLQ